MTGGTGFLVDVLAGIADGDQNRILRLLAQTSVEDVSSWSSFRAAVFNPVDDPIYYRKIWNLWRSAHKPSLKSVSSSVTIQLLGDGTLDGLVPYLELFLAAYGVVADVSVAPFDSAETEAFIAPPKDYGVTLLVLSDNWLKKTVGPLPASESAVNAACNSVKGLSHGIKSKRDGLVIATSFGFGAWPAASTMARIPGHYPWSMVLAQVNQALYECTSAGFGVVDGQLISHMAGGCSSIGSLSQLRMRSPYEERGWVELAREAAAIIAHSQGRGHRALVTDWDNTIWGGEVGDLGSSGVELGPETPDGVGYLRVQEYIRDLSRHGVAVAALSRNDPVVQSVLVENEHIALKRENYASIQLSWGNKSDGLRLIQSELSFGTDLMLYLDDNHVDLAEVSLHFPDLDVVLAGPNPDETLARLSRGRYFSCTSVTSGDLQRLEQFEAMQKQRIEFANAGSAETFLKSLEIAVSVSSLNDANRERALQLLQKTNQFNLTSRRHTAGDLKRLQESNAQFAVFDYRDRFGSQGIIGFMILVPLDGEWEIDTWLMSCRVLNRGVEEEMLSWAMNSIGDGKLIGRYFPTQKNALVSDLFVRLGFRPRTDGAFEMIIKGNAVDAG